MLPVLVERGVVRAREVAAPPVPDELAPLPVDDEDHILVPGSDEHGVASVERTAHRQLGVPVPPRRVAVQEIDDLAPTLAASTGLLERKLRCCEEVVEREALDNLPVRCEERQLVVGDVVVRVDGGNSASCEHERQKLAVRSQADVVVRVHLVAPQDVAVPGETHQVATRVGRILDRAFVEPRADDHEIAIGRAPHVPSDDRGCISGAHDLAFRERSWHSQLPAKTTRVYPGEARVRSRSFTPCPAPSRGKPRVLR